VAAVSIEEHGGWPGVLGVLSRREDLSEAAAHDVMATILAGDATSAQIGAFIVALRMKGEVVAELTGLLTAMREASETVPIDAAAAGLIDTCGTGGDQSHSINVSTIAAFVVAGAGGKVCKHGNRAASSKCGSADVLEALGVNIDLGPEGVAACIGEAGIGFCLAPRFHPAMRHAGPPRRELGVPTVFNFLGPMANPARVERQVIGVSDPAMAPLMLEVLAASGTTQAMVVHGHDGLDELSTVSSSSVLELRNGETRSYEVDPADLGFAAATAEDLRGGSADENAAFARAVLAGTSGPHRDIVVLNAAAGIVVAGLADDLGGGVQLASAAIDDGAPLAALDALVDVSQRLG
jgi:anthranilate phosphoribosyltransferase